MTIAAQPISDPIVAATLNAPSQSVWAMAMRSGRVMIGGGVLLLLLGFCVLTLFWTLRRDSALYYDRQQADMARFVPFTRPVPDAKPDATGAVPIERDSRPVAWFGYDTLGRSIFARCLLGGTISMGVGVAAATISVVLGVAVGLIAGYRGGWVDSVLMRFVDILYGLPYILLVILFKIGFEPMFASGSWLSVFMQGLGICLVLSLLIYAIVRPIQRPAGAARPVAIAIGIALLLSGGTWLWALMTWDRPESRLFPKVPLSGATANLIVLFSAIGLVSWLTMARVVRGQVLSLRGQPFIEATRAMGLPSWRIFLKHILPNLVGPVTVYATLTVPQAILQESFLSFLGVGINPPLPSWGWLASNAIENLSPVRIYWWMLLFPCILLVVTLLSLNFMGDGLRDIFDPKREGTKL